MNPRLSQSKCAGLLTLLSILLASGCSPPIGAPLHGTWGIASADSLSKKLGGIIQTNEKDGKSVDTANETSDERNSQTPDEARDEDDSQPRMRLEFSSSGKLTTMTEMGRISPPPKTGTWKVVSYDKPANQMTIECDLAGQVTEHEVILVDSDTIELIPPNMAGTRSRLTFKRMKFQR